MLGEDWSEDGVWEDVEDELVDFGGDDGRAMPSHQKPRSPPAKEGSSRRRFSYATMGPPEISGITR
jgi:hypothetical protein